MEVRHCHEPSEHDGTKCTSGQVSSPHGRQFDIGGYPKCQLTILFPLPSSTSSVTGNPRHSAHACNVRALVLERLPNGEHAWLKPAVFTDPESDDALCWPTQRGRDLVARWAAEVACLGSRNLMK